jgi:hypothetical protein
MFVPICDFVQASGICLRQTAEKMWLRGRNYALIVWQLLVDDEE